jgi:hypothetical protein
MGAPPTSLVLHNSGIGDLTYLPTVAYVIPEDESTHTVVAATMYVSAPFGTYDQNQTINIGDNRWRLQPQVAVGQRFLKTVTAELVGSLAFYTANDKAGPAVMGTSASLKQDPTLGLEAHVAADLSPTFYTSASYYLAAAGKKTVSFDGATVAASSTPAQSIGTVRFDFGIHVEKGTLLLLQYNQDIFESGGAPISRFIGARLSHVLVL